MEPNPDTAELVAKPDFNWRLYLVDVSVPQYHFVPGDDTTEHDTSSLCPCKPDLVGLREAPTGDWLPLFNHHSYDLREIAEWWFFNIEHPEIK